MMKMAENSFEKRVREQLKKREIRPSASAWLQLSERLNGSVERKKYGSPWYAVAAGFALLLVGALFFTLGSDPHGVSEQEQWAKTPVTNPETNEGILSEAEQNDEPLANTEPVAVLERSPGGEKEVGNTTATEAVGEVYPLPSSTVLAIESKLAEVVARVKVLEEARDSVSDAEIDALLRQAQLEVMADKSLQQHSKISATALLSEVESELDRSFRDQIFEKLKTGFIKVRTAVADRNN